MYKVITEDKLDDRWRRGVFVGKVDQTDEFVMVTPDGVKKSRSIRREIKPNKFDPKFLATCKGLPWAPQGQAADTTSVTKRSDPVVAGARLRRMYITRQ